MRRSKIGRLLCVLAALLLLCMPGTASVALAAEDGSQEKTPEPLVIDLTKGYYEKTYSDYDQAAICLAVERIAHKREDEISYCYIWGEKVDLDGDGTYDVLADGADWSDVDGAMPSRWFLIPTSECSIRGSITFKDIKDERFSEVTFLFPDEPIRKEYAVTMEKGHAETEDGKTVTSAAPGTVLFLVPDNLEGEYVTAWNSELTGQHNRYDSVDRRMWGAAEFHMPAADVILAAETEAQTPLTFEMSNGYCIVDDDPYRKPNISDFAIPPLDESEDEGLFLMDLDSDGTYDACLYVVYGVEYGAIIDAGLPWHVYMIPLPTSSITGTYRIDGETTAPYWPYTFVFPAENVKSTHRITVNGGHAENMKGETITEAAPGEKIKIIYDRKAMETIDKGFVASPAYENLTKTADMYGSSYLREETVMPACDITYTAQVKGCEAIVLNFIRDGEKWIAPLPYDVRAELQQFGRELDESFFYWYYDFSPMMDAYANNVSMNAIQVKGRNPETMTFSMTVPLLTSEALYSAITVKFPGAGEIYPINCTDENLRIGLTDLGADKLSTILGAVEGQYLVVEGWSIEEPVASQFVGFEAKDFWMEYNAEAKWVFRMPDHAIEIKPVFQKIEQKPLTIDLSDGYAEIPFGTSFLDSVLESSGTGYHSGGNIFDLNGDGLFDVALERVEENRFRRLADYSLGETYTLPYGNHGAYYPITFVNHPKANEQSEVSPTAAPSANEDTPTPTAVVENLSDSPAGTPQENTGKNGDFLPALIVVAAVLLIGVGILYFVILPKKDAAKREEKRRQMREQREKQLAEETSEEDDYT